MRAAIVLAILIGAALPAYAGEGFDIVIPGRPGVPIIINGVDVSYAVVEGDFGLGQGYHRQPTVYGGRYVDPVVSATMLLADEGPTLTDRERAVLRLAADGRTSAAIGAQLGLSEGTVRNYLSEAIGKVGAENRTEAARIARDRGWL